MSVKQGNPGKMKSSPALYAKSAGILLLISILAGVFGEVFVLSKLIVPGDANGTAANIRESDLLFRLGFASFSVTFCGRLRLALNLLT